MNDILHDFSAWAEHQWVDNCTERDMYGDKHLSFREYFNKNKKFLHDEYIKNKNEERNANI